MAVTLDDLSRDRGRLQPQALTNLFFEFRLQMRKRSYRAGKLAHAHLFRAALESLDVPHDFGVPVGQLQSERGWFSVNAVGPADGGRVLKFVRAAGQHSFQLLQVFGDDP